MRWTENILNLVRRPPWWLKLLVIPYAQAIFMAIAQLMINRFNVPGAWTASFLLNLCWWMNTRQNQDTRHIRGAGLIYAVSFSTGVITGMVIFRAL